MERPVLGDRSQFPTDEVIFSHLGGRRALWEALFAFIRAEHPDGIAEWRYYQDGKSWLLNLSRKKKTVFWLSLAPGRTFRVTAYFTDKAKDAIEASTLSRELKDQFRAGRSFGTLKAVTITFTRKKDVEDAKVLVALKTS